MGSGQDASFIYPMETQLTGGGNAVLDHVAASKGRWARRVGAGVVLLTDRPDRQDIDVRRAIRGMATAVAVHTVDAGTDIALQWLGIGGEADLRAALDALDVDECLVVTARDGSWPQPIDAARRTRRSGGVRMPAIGVPAGATLRHCRP